MIDTIALIVSIVGAVTLALVSVGRMGRRLPFVGHWRRGPDPVHFKRYMLGAALPGLPGLAMVMLSERLLARAGLPLLGVGFILAVHACQPGRSWWRTAAALGAVAAGGGIWLLAAERGARSDALDPIVVAGGIMLGAITMAVGMWAYDGGPRHPDYTEPNPDPWEGGMLNVARTPPQHRGWLHVPHAPPRPSGLLNIARTPSKRSPRPPDRTGDTPRP